MFKFSIVLKATCELKWEPLNEAGPTGYGHADKLEGKAVRFKACVCCCFTKVAINPGS